MENNIKIETQPRFSPERSDPTKPYYFFSYRVRIINNHEKTVQLLSRYWHISDGEGRVEDIHGLGVVGQTPSINPKQFFEYTSFCPLQTPIGFMEGSYRMSLESGEEFDVLIPQFKLVAKEFLN